MKQEDKDKLWAEASAAMPDSWIILSKDVSFGSVGVRYLKVDSHGASIANAVWYGPNASLSDPDPWLRNRWESYGGVHLSNSEWSSLKDAMK